MPVKFSVKWCHECKNSEWSETYYWLRRSRKFVVKQRDVFRELRRSDKLIGKLLVILWVKLLISPNVEKQNHTNISSDTFYRGLSFRGVIFTKFSQSRKWWSFQGFSFSENGKNFFTRTFHPWVYRLSFVPHFSRGKIFDSTGFQFQL